MKTKKKISRFAFLSLLVLLAGCQAEEDVSQYPLHQQQANLNLKRLSFSELKLNKPALQRLQVVKNQKRGGTNLGKGVFNNDYGVFIDTTSIYMIEKDNNHSITFKIISDEVSDEKVENLIL